MKPINFFKFLNNYSDFDEFQALCNNDLNDEYIENNITGKAINNIDGMSDHQLSEGITTFRVKNKIKFLSGRQNGVYNYKNNNYTNELNNPFRENNQITSVLFCTRNGQRYYFNDMEIEIIYHFDDTYDRLCMYTDPSWTYFDDTYTSKNVLNKSTNTTIKALTSGPAYYNEWHFKAIKDGTIISNPSVRLDLIINGDVFATNVTGYELFRTLMRYDGNPDALWEYVSDSFSTISYPTSFFAIALGQDPVSLQYSIDTNAWWFASNNDAENYLRSGNPENNLNNYEYKADVDKTEDVEYYIHSVVWESIAPSDAEKTTISNHWTKITTDGTVKRPFTLRVIDEDSQVLHLNISNLVDDTNIVKIEESTNGGITWTTVSLDTMHNNWWRYNITKKSGNNYQGARTYTNIPIFRSNLEENSYFLGLIDEDSSLNPTESIKDQLLNKIIDIGNGIKTHNTLNMQTVRTEMSEIVVGNSAFFGELANKLNDDSFVNQLVEGIKMHSNPSDIFIDMFALPFRVELIEEVSADKHDMDFGTYVHTFNSSFKTVSGAKEIEMFSTEVVDIYRDWRSYEMNVYLYLPYVNFIQLNVNDVVGKRLSCTFVFDVASSTIKYFIKTNNITIQTVEGSVRVGLPLSASNNVQGFMQKLEGASQLVQAYQEQQNREFAFVGGVASIATGDVGSGVDTLLSAKNAGFSVFSKGLEGASNIFRPTPKIMTGNYASSTAFYDELNAYIVLEQSTFLYPDNIKETYNLPDNRVGTVGSCKGYMEMKNARLITNATASEKNEILQFLEGGVIV